MSEVAPPAAGPRPPRVWTVFVGFAVVFVAVQVLGGLALAAWAYLLSVPGSGLNGFAAAFEGLIASPSGLAVAAAISASGLAAGALMGARLSPEPWRQRLRLTTRGVTARQVALCVVGTLAVSHALDALIGLLGLARFGALDHINRVLQRATAGDLVVLTLALAVGPGIAEELFFRGFMQTRLSRRFGAAAGVAIAAACFGFIHLDPVHMPVAALLGVFLGWAAERTGSIVPAMAAHFANNLVAVLTAGVVLPSSTSARLGFLLGGLAVAGLVVHALGRSPQVDPDPPAEIA